MRDIYKYNHIPSWKAYYAEKAKGFPYSGTAALKLNDGCTHPSRNDKALEPGAQFAPYWTALELIHEGRRDALKLTVEEILAKCRKNYETELGYYRRPESHHETYKGHPLIWEMYRPYKEEFNWIDIKTLRCVVPVKLTDEECEEIREGLWQHWYNPYDDGRDCTGVWFTSSISFYRCTDRTIIQHTLHKDI